ncbi:glycosyltransferase [Candidatus Microgenomates bacterium]|nr:glycosyltransferase [Candidatus Microgenomates bacterium]
MDLLDIIIPVKNESENVEELTQRIDRTMGSVNIPYFMIFVDDHSTDDTVSKLNVLSRKYPIKIHIKQGKPGKAFSILEGAELTTSEFIAMIDGDLQYPPEALPKLYLLAQQFGVAVANRKISQGGALRRIASKINNVLFGKFLLGFNCDNQSGLKVFKREIIEHINPQEITKWTLDMPLLFTATELGYTIAGVDIIFEERQKGQSKINFLQATAEIALGALRLKLRRRKIYTIKPQKEDSAIGAGIVYKRRRFITHTTLPHQSSAFATLNIWQKLALLGIFGFLIAGLLLNAQATAIVFIAAVSTIYFLDVIFSLVVLLKSLHFPPEIKIPEEELSKTNDKELPVYSILCPLYREGRILPHFLQSLTSIDWPKEKLEVLLLIEQDDEETKNALKQLLLPFFVHVLIVPDSFPRTKPKACNFGLAYAKGEYVVVYDAEDRPDPLQLKKAYFAFQKGGKRLFCLQSKLNYYNPHHNLLTRLFTAEYSLWFDIILPGLQSIQATIPLGGTSNHFRTQDIRALHAWDPFNVTEDCDLGVRIFKQGYKTAIIDSTTLEEANSNVKNWIRQRSRWIKGYIQTYFVHTRNPLKFAREHGIHSLIFHLVVGMRISFMLINPFLWVATISYFALYRYVGPAIEALYPAPVFYIAVFSLVFGNFMYLYNYMIGAAKRGQMSLVKFVFFIPLYWLLASIAAGVALYQLLIKPHYWEKTHHGLHLKEQEDKRQKEIKRVQAQEARREQIGRIREWAETGLVGGGFLIAASGISNFINFLYSAYLGRSLSVEEFGLISLINSLLALSSVITGSLGKTITHRSAYLLGKYGHPVKEFWAYIRARSITISLAIALLWFASIPFLQYLFKSESPIPFLLFTPIWIVGLASAVDSGFLGGNLKFFVVGCLMLVEAVTKLGLTYFLVELGEAQWVYSTIPASAFITFLIGWVVVVKMKETKKPVPIVDTRIFPKAFMGTSVLAKLSSVAFLSLDVALAKLYLSPLEAGQYALLSLAGKMIFFSGALTTQFINPVISHKEGASEDTTGTFYKFLIMSTFASIVGFITLGMFGELSVPLLFGEKTTPILSFLPLYTLGIACFTIATAIVSYHQARRHYVFPLVGFILSIGQVVGIIVAHGSVAEVSGVVATVGGGYLVIIAILHLMYGTLVTAVRNIIDFFGLITTETPLAQRNGNLRILILNWRDAKHMWAGGAEVYVHELAKRWVASGHKVTLFCGNDQESPRNEVIDGIQIVRRGGFYMVYLWAFLYYVLRFRGLFDVVIDCENGIPFFTPLFTRKPKFLVIHHVHQDVFRNHLKFPLSLVASFLESKVMPVVYKNQKVITVSESSKAQIKKLGISGNGDIQVIPPGVDIASFPKTAKTVFPSFIYLGRLKPYKNIDVAIKAFSSVVQSYPTAKLAIAGEGESMAMLQKLVKELKLERSVIFTKKVSEKLKAQYLAQSWAALQPSSFEGWGITVIEANAAGTPVIASNVNGLCDSVVDGKTGLLVPVKDISLFAKAMTDLIREPAYRRELSRGAYKWAQRFSWDRSSQELLRVIENELAQDKRYSLVLKPTLTER